MGGIFDGIQRPLKDINEMTQSIYIPKVSNSIRCHLKQKWGKYIKRTIIVLEIDNQ